MCVVVVVVVVAINDLLLLSFTALPTQLAII